MGCSHPKEFRAGLRNILAFLKVELQHFLGGTLGLLPSAARRGLSSLVYLRPMDRLLQSDLGARELEKIGHELLDTAQTRQRLFFPICDHSSSSFAVENNWRRPHLHLPERPLKIGIWIEKIRCQNSNLNLPTIKKRFLRLFVS